MTKANLQKFLNILKLCKDVASSPTEIISKTLEDSITTLDNLKITYEETAEGIKVLLKTNAYEIYKTKEDTIKFSNNFDIPVMVIFDELIYYPGAPLGIFFENLIYSQKIKELVIERQIVSFNDLVKKNFILLSETKGKLEVGYKIKLPHFYENEHNLKTLYAILQKKLNEPEYISFFRDNIIEKIENIDNVNNRFLGLLEKLNNITEKSNREFELYKNNFSFDKFQSSLEKEKEKYMKSLQENLGDFLSKINALPIQFGVYMFLIFRFEYQPIPLLATAILILSWSYFSFFSLEVLINTVKLVEKSFDDSFYKILSKSGLEENDLKKDKQQVKNKIKDIKNLIKTYQITIVIFSITFLIFICFKLVPNQ